jgi:hypothetical protein
MNEKSQGNKGQTSFYKDGKRKRSENYGSSDRAAKDPQ